jgi:hypothetical protein
MNQMTLYLPNWLRDALRGEAERRAVSLNAVIRLILADHVALADPVGQANLSGPSPLMPRPQKNESRTPDAIVASLRASARRVHR